ncbi:MAG: zinc ribbon domain-containing protein [Fidelibacterota bacterium]|nr:MAG: zinc ribbon domain-containing protein [Candidatus Neomarinimicrobiota bacterium]
MPIYDYRCRACDNSYIALVPSSETPASDIECPRCKEHQSEKQLSMKTAIIGGNSSSSAATTCSAPAGSGFT